MADNKENKGKHNVNIVQLSNYVKPVIKESKSKEWVLNGDKNQFFQYVIDRYNGSPTNGAIISGFSNLIYGKGLSARDANKKPLEYAKMVTLFRPDEVRKMVLDFKLQGQFAMQIIYNRDRSISSITHFPVETLAPEKMNEEGEIEAYYYSADWCKPRGDNKPIRISAYGMSNDGREMYVCRPYEAGQMYFALPDYVQGLQYAEVEEEISNFYLNHIHNGFSFGYILNMNNGETLNDKQKYELQQSIRREMTGSSNAGKVVVSFNNGKEQEATIVPLEVNDAHNQWENLNRESEEKIMRAHKVVSPMIFGIKNNTGLGNNADELVTGMALLMDMTINPMQEFMLDKFKNILANEGISLDLFFKPLSEEEQEQEEVEKIKENTQLKSKSKTEQRANGGVADELIKLGENFDIKKWYVLSECEVDYNTDDYAHDLIKIGLSTSTGTARPNSKSEQDSDDIVIRYRYTGNKQPQREFCQKMMKADKVYRKEDIIQMENKAVNPGWGLNGADTYSIWLYKGGGNCRHKWNRVIYLKKDGNVDVNSPLAKTITTSEARRRGYSVPTNENLVSIEPNKMPNNGFVNK